MYLYNLRRLFITTGAIFNTLNKWKYVFIRIFYKISETSRKFLLRPSLFDFYLILLVLYFILKSRTLYIYSIPQRLSINALSHGIVVSCDGLIVVGMISCHDTIHSYGMNTVCMGTNILARYKLSINVKSYRGGAGIEFCSGVAERCLLVVVRLPLRAFSVDHRLDYRQHLLCLSDATLSLQDWAGFSHNDEIFFAVKSRKQVAQQPAGN